MNKVTTPKEQKKYKNYLHVSKYDLDGLRQEMANKGLTNEAVAQLVVKRMGEGWVSRRYIQGLLSVSSNYKWPNPEIMAAIQAVIEEAANE
jgi:hypothetical protein